MTTLYKTINGDILSTDLTEPIPTDFRSAWKLDGTRIVIDDAVKAEVLKTRINQEWDRRVFSGFSFGGKMYASDRDSIANVAGAASWAQSAMASGISAGNLYWDAEDPSSPTPSDLPFAWKAMDGTFTPMDAPTVEQFGIALARHKQKMFRAAQALKSSVPIPGDYDDDKYWI